MSNYTKTTNFTAKDSLTTGDTNKVIRGSEHDTEYSAIAVAIATKEDSANKNAASGYAGLDGSSRLATTVMPAFTGDVTTTAGAVATTIAASAVTLAKMANLAQATIIGRQTGVATGVPQALSSADLSNILSIAGLPANALTGTLVNGTVAASNVTQHQAALSIAFTQLTGTATTAQIPSLDTAKITTGTFADARVAQSNVTQYQASFKGRNVSSKSGTSFTIQSGGTASGGSDGDMIGIY